MLFGRKHQEVLLTTILDTITLKNGLNLLLVIQK